MNNVINNVIKREFYQINISYKYNLLNLYVLLLQYYQYTKIFR